MGEKQSSIAGRSLWTIGTYLAATSLRFLTNVVLARLLGPEILGVVVVAQAVRIGAELLSDLGMEQNVVHSAHGDDHDYLNTVWTLQIIRGAFVSLACATAAYLIATFYDIPVTIVLAISAAPLLNALSSTSIFTLTRNGDVKRRGLFELCVEAVGLVLNIALALLLHDIWAPILGILLTIAIRSWGSYLLPHPKHRPLLRKAHGQDILHYSKWVMLSSLMFFCAVYADRLFIGRTIGLATLGIYGLARAISDLPHVVASRLSTQVLFPFVAQNRTGVQPHVYVELGRTRRSFLLLAAIGIATVMAWSDWTIRLLYDSRYREAGWMLFVLLAGSWIGVLSSLNEATLFGHGRPRDVSFANLARVVVLAIGLPGGLWLAGLPGVVVVLPVSELARYLVLRAGQRTLPTTFALQDVVTSLSFAATLAAWIAVRATAGGGVPWASMS